MKFSKDEPIPDTNVKLNKNPKPVSNDDIFFQITQQQTQLTSNVNIQTSENVQNSMSNSTFMGLEFGGGVAKNNDNDKIDKNSILALYNMKPVASAGFSQGNAGLMLQNSSSSNMINQMQPAQLNNRTQTNQLSQIMLNNLNISNSSQFEQRNMLNSNSSPSNFNMNFFNSTMNSSNLSINPPNINLANVC